MGHADDAKLTDHDLGKRCIVDHGLAEVGWGGSLSWQLKHADDASLIDHAHGRECFVDRGLVGVGVGLISFLFFLLTGACR